MAGTKLQPIERGPSYKTLFSLLMLSALLLAGALSLRNFLYDPNMFPLQVVEVKGDFSHLDRKHLEQVVASELRGGFFSADIHGIQRAVMRFPWVRLVSVSRHWPDRLVMWVEEQSPLAIWGDSALLNQQGEIFAPEEIDTSMSLRLFGDDQDAAEVVNFYRQIEQQIKGETLVIKRFGKNRHRDWIVEFGNGLRINMGRDHAAMRLQQFLRALSSIRTAGKKPESVDLRYDHGFSVHWVDRPEVQPGGDA